MIAKSQSVRFTTKGQVVIPSALRRQFDIREGTRAIIEATPEGILLKPVSRHAVERLRGILKRKPGEKTLAQEWPAHLANEKALEDHGRRTRSR